MAISQEPSRSATARPANLGDIEAIEPYTKGFFRQTAVKDAATAAVARITARLAPNAVVGSLSVSDDGDGALALAVDDEG